MFNCWCQFTFMLYIVALLCAHKGFSADDTDCRLYDNDELLPETKWEYGYYLNKIQDITPAGTILVTLTTKNVLEIMNNASDTSSNLTYVNISMDNEKNIFKITLTEDFQYYELYETKDELKINVTFKCQKNTRKLDIYQKIEDTNNHNPEFLEAPYEYILPMPFPPNLQVDLFGKKIAARDIDLTNKNISFALNSSDSNSGGFSVNWISQDKEDIKKHYAILKSIDFLNLRNNVTFDLYATDDGKPPRTSKTHINIKINKTTSYPRFSRPLYTVDYRNINLRDVKIIEFLEGPITMSQGVDETVMYDLQTNPAEYKDIFEVCTSKDLLIIQLHLKEVPSSLLNETLLILILNALKSGATDSTVLHISLPGRHVYTDTDTSTIMSILISSLILGSLFILLSIAMIIVYWKNRNIKSTSV